MICTGCKNNKFDDGKTELRTTVFCGNRITFTKSVKVDCLVCTKCGKNSPLTDKDKAKENFIKLKEYACL